MTEATWTQNAPGRAAAGVRRLARAAVGAGAPGARRRRGGRRLLARRRPRRSAASPGRSARSAPASAAGPRASTADGARRGAARGTAVSTAGSASRRRRDRPAAAGTPRRSRRAAGVPPGRARSSGRRRTRGRAPAAARRRARPPDGRSGRSGSACAARPRRRSVTGVVRATPWLPVLQEHLDQVDRQREDDRRVLLGGDLGQRLQVAQLQRRRLPVDDLAPPRRAASRPRTRPAAWMILARFSRSASACFAMARCISGGRSTCLTSTSETLMPQGSVCSSMTFCSVDVQLLALGEQLVEVRLAEDAAQRRLRQLRGGVEVVLDLDDRLARARRRGSRRPRSPSPRRCPA